MNNSTAVSSVIPFRFEAKEVRTVLIDDQPWFVAQDVMDSLEYAEGYKPARALGHIPDQWKGVQRMHTLGGAQQLLTISEQGLYFFIGRSDKPKALSFQMWLAGEVLPAIRKHGRYEDQGKMATLIGQTIGTDGFHMLGAVVKGKVSSLPAVAQRRATAKIWSQIHAAFGVRSAADIPADQLDSARNFIAAYVVLDGDYIAREPAKTERLNIHFPIQALAGRREGMLTERGDGQAWLDVSLQDVGYHHESLCEMIIFELQRAGYVVDAAQWELATYRNKLRGIASFVCGLNQVVENPQRYAVAGEAA